MKHGCPFLNEKHRKRPKNRGGWQAQGAGGGPERGWNGWTGGNACHRLSVSCSKTITGRTKNIISRCVVKAVVLRLLRV
jgi:hypothetical protein